MVKKNTTDVAVDNGKIKYNYDISMGLLGILKNGGSFQEILDFGYEMMKTPMLLVDVSFNYLASAGFERIQDEPVWEYTVKNGFMPNYYLNSIAGAEYKDGRNILELDTEKITHIKHSQKSVRIFQKEKILGYLYIMDPDDKEYYEEEESYDIVKLIADYLSISMSRNLGGENLQFSVIENFLTSILRNKIINSEEIRTRQELFGIKLYDVLHVITIEINDFRVSEEKKNNIVNKIKKFFDRNNVLVLNSYIVVLYDTKTREEAFSDIVMTEFSSLLEANNCRANISFSFSSLTEFYKYYVHTVYCIKMRELLGNHDTIVSYGDVIDYHMLLCFAEQVDINLLVHDSVKELMQIDRENDSNYVETLFTYINCQQNLAKAAEKMFLHYNTLKYRINRIVALTGVDLNDRDTVFSIIISEKILIMKDLMAKSNLNYFDFSDIVS